MALRLVESVKRNRQGEITQVVAKFALYGDTSNFSDLLLARLCLPPASLLVLADRIFPHMDKSTLCLV